MAFIIDFTGDNPDIEGTDGSDIIVSLGGDDVILSGDGNDFVLAGSGDDDVFGEGGNDIIFGGSGNDTLDGGAGTDILIGNSDNDTLIGGLGDDLLIGGSGADVFSFDQAGGSTGDDVLLDFEVGTDTLDLTGTGLTELDFSDTSIFDHDAGNNTLTINIDADTSIVLLGIDATEFSNIADSIMFDAHGGGCRNESGTAASDTFTLALDDCLTVTGFELGNDPDTIDLSAFGVTAEGLSALDTAFNTALETDLANLDFFFPPNDILTFIGDRNSDGSTDNDDIEQFRQDFLNLFGFGTQAEEDAFNEIIDAFLTYDFAVDFSTSDITLDITRDADGTTAGELTLIGLGGDGGFNAFDLFEDHMA